MDGDPSHTGLLKFAITEENFENILVLLVASMANPWSIMESLNKWASYLREHIDRLKLKPEERREYEDSRKLDCSQLSIHFYSGRKSCKYYCLEFSVVIFKKKWGLFHPV